MQDEEWGGMVLVAYVVLAAMIVVTVLLVLGVATLVR
jgi:hypothetical protein